MASPAEQEQAAGTIPAAQAAQLLMMTTERLRQLAKDGWIEKEQRGRYKTVNLVQGYIRFLRDEDRRSSKSAADVGLKAARQREVEIRTAEREGRLIDRSTATDVVDTIAGKFIAGLSGLPARATRDLVIRREIERHCDDLRNEIAAFAASQRSTVGAAGQPSGGEAEEDA
jgi:phage terminase Nu1 subunit (DNA packaging protein)